MATSWSGLYLDFAVGMTDYIDRHIQNYTRIQYCLDYLNAMSGGQTTIFDVPNGLQQIFDRKGLIGIHSYEFTPGVLTGPDYNLQFAAGAYWNGSAFRSKLATTTIAMTGKPSGTYYVNLDAGGNPGISTSQGADAIWSFVWDGSNTISAKTLVSGVAVLFCGADYADCLTSTQQALTFTSLADRLESIEILTGGGNVPGDYVYDKDTSSGLSFHYKAGRVRNDNVIIITNAGSVTLTANAFNYIELEPSTGVVSVNQAGFTQGKIPLYFVQCAAAPGGGQALDIEDRRCWLDGKTSGGIVTLTPGDAVTVDWSKGKKQSLLLNRTTTTITFSNGVNGESCILMLVQDGTGGRLATFTSEVRAGADLHLPPELSSAINKTDYLGFIYQAAPNKYDYVSLSRGY